MPEKRQILTLLQGLIFTLPLLAGSAAAEPGWDVAGIRGGADLTDIHSRADGFRVYEAFASYRLPFEWCPSARAAVATRLEVSAGALTREDNIGFIGTLGPTAVLALFDDTVEIDGGVSVAYLSSHDYPYRNLGGPIQFVLRASVGGFVSRHIGIGYHFEHISNSNLYRFNPGVNLQTLELKYRF